MSRMHIVKQRCSKLPGSRPARQRVFEIGGTHDQPAAANGAFKYKRELMVSIPIVDRLHYRIETGRQRIHINGSCAAHYLRPLPIELPVGREFGQGRMSSLNVEPEHAAPFGHHLAVPGNGNNIKRGIAPVELRTPREKQYLASGRKMSLRLTPRCRDQYISLWSALDMSRIQPEVPIVFDKAVLQAYDQAVSAWRRRPGEIDPDAPQRNVFADRYGSRRPFALRDQCAVCIRNLPHRCCVFYRRCSEMGDLHFDIEVIRSREHPLLQPSQYHSRITESAKLIRGRIVFGIPKRIQQSHRSSALARIVAQTEHLKSR